MQNQYSIKKFVYRTLLMAWPFAVMLVLYFATDVFKVLYDYDSFFEEGQPGRVVVNKDYVSVTTFDKQFATYGYDSFILGNSRSIFYEIADWEKYLLDQSSCFHLDASRESLYGLYRKVLYLDKKGSAMKNVLLVIDHSVLMQTKGIEGHLFCSTPQLVDDYMQVPKFHLSFIKAFFNLKFLYALADYKITGKVKDYMTEAYLLTDIQEVYNRQTNEIKQLQCEQEIADGTFYTEKRLRGFDNKSFPDSIAEPVIKSAQLEMLTAMKLIFEKHNTQCKIVISPLYEQICLNPIDLRILESVFGEGTVFDFSGTNEFTTDYRNYYENSHYRPHVARRILNQVYTHP